MSLFVTVKGSQFYRNGERYMIKGANYWQGMNLAAPTRELGGDRTRLLIELDQLQKMGVNNLRIMASSEGPDEEPYRMRPSLQPSIGHYNEHLFEALDYLLDEMSKRGMTAVMTLSNFWHWSGGFSQYIAWITKETIPYPVTRDKWDTFTEFTKRFYNDPTIRQQVNQLYKNHIRVVQTRRNTINGKLYNEDPVIMSWQIANEPQLAPKDWFEEIACFIKQKSPYQLVSSGIESKVDRVDFMNAHESNYIDYCTCHCWVENWGIYDPSDVNSKKKSLSFAINYIKEYIMSRYEWSLALVVKKPIVLEEFGMARDAWRKPLDSEYKYDPSTPTSHKDIFFKEGVYETIEKLSNCYGGSNFWAYGGIGRSTDKPNSNGMVWLGDPPHEPKGWYSVYDTDTTVDIIKQHFMNL
ncbi:glycoside hydrolase superfamily [Cokeromyces recurvatus]|uniref:glycoside hydrolase superfamily n=1 Tax=Cokeromyces recurvatus TaxID=90255 RepID=UPI0022201DB1|nr:glycoside hydrolase superfamily [Cokeromyces recurvatus]KAI7906703.1 glycoside hydrolase superfamily [Cokeromyces recurvatus]